MLLSQKFLDFYKEICFSFKLLSGLLAKKIKDGVLLKKYREYAAISQQHCLTANNFMCCTCGPLQLSIQTHICLICDWPCFLHAARVISTI